MREVRRGLTLTKAMFTSAPSRPAGEAGTGTWTSIGDARTVADGDIKAFPQSGGAVAVANVGGTFYAFDDTCTHKRCSLAEGELDGTTVTCICHGSEFDITNGDVKHGPAERPVGSYPVRVEAGEIRILR